MTTVAATGDEDTDETTAALAAIADNFDKAEVIISLYEFVQDICILFCHPNYHSIHEMSKNPELFNR